MRRRIAAQMLWPLMLGATLAGCAQVPAYQPPVELQGFDAARYRTDLEDCRKAADLDRYGPVLAGVLVGAGVGAGLGNVAGWAVGGNLAVATGWGAASGAVLGGGAGVGISEQRPSDAAAIDDCLRANGYKLMP
ncbi:MAG TPA: hypothetical protein VN832_06265 [Stellaceae bacterium]|nr:hypothetical protein [Stellaceae bacterium]